MAYWLGDIPAEDIVIEPARRGEPIDLAPFDPLDTLVELRTFDGDLIDADFTVTFLTAEPDDIDRVVLKWPAESVLTNPGVSTLSVTLAGLDAQERLAPIPLVVQDDDGWHSLDSARDEWSDAEAVSDVRLYTLLDLARQQVLAYGPELAEGSRPPSNYRAAQLMQARNLLNAGRAEGGESGEDFVLRPFPLDWMVKQIIRPHRAVPAVG